MRVTKYEKARIVGARALQIAMGAPMLMKVAKKDFEEMNFSPIEIAKREFNNKLLPISIKRPLPKKKV
tara:strand:- start:216 stop:419 length:204 start_codon:yes stop_codon:yes gene_type:complete